MLQQHLKGNAARVAFVSIFLIALIRVKTVNLAEIATGFSSGAKLESRYKRLRRFFREIDLIGNKTVKMPSKLYSTSPNEQKSYYFSTTSNSQIDVWSFCLIKALTPKGRLRRDLSSGSII